jgi:HEAT repeat protein
VRETADSAITQISSKKLVPALKRALSHEDEMVRLGAAYYLWNLGREARPAAGALKKALKDPSEKVRDTAAAALEAIRE